MTKAELIERHGIEWYEQYKVRTNAQCKVRKKEHYHNDPKYRESEKARHNEHYQNDPKYRESKKARQRTEYQREYHREYKKNDLNSNGKTKDNIRVQSRYILFDKRHHSKLKGYEIHHCFGYEDPSKFIYIPKVLHTKIHQFLRDNNIDANSNHFNSIAQLINECTEYTYVSA